MRGKFTHEKSSNQMLGCRSEKTLTNHGPHVISKNISFGLRGAAISTSPSWKKDICHILYISMHYQKHNILIERYCNSLLHPVESFIKDQTFQWPVSTHHTWFKTLHFDQEVLRFLAPSSGLKFTHSQNIMHCNDQWSHMAHHHKHTLLTERCYDLLLHRAGNKMQLGNNVIHFRNQWSHITHDQKHNNSIERCCKFCLPQAAWNIHICKLWYISMTNDHTSCIINYIAFWLRGVAIPYSVQRLEINTLVKFDNASSWSIVACEIDL